MVGLPVAAVVVLVMLAVSACTGLESDSAEPPDGSATTQAGPGGDVAEDAQPESESGSDSESGPEPGSDSGAGSDSESGEVSNAEVLELLAELPGQLAVGNGTELLVGRADGQSLVQLDGGDAVLASQPTWSNDGNQLVWTSADADAQLSKVLSFDDEGLPDGDPLVSDAAGPPIFYYQWSSDDTSLLYLRNSPAGAQVEAGRLSPGVDVAPVAVGTPFFASWAPDGQSVAVHRNSFEIGVFDQFSSAEEVEDPEVTGPIAQLPRTRGEFTTPGWISNRQVVVVNDGDLVIADVDLAASSMQVARQLLTDVGSVRFVVSPDGSKVALQQPPEQGAEVVEAVAPRSLDVSEAPSGRLLPVQGGDPTLVVLDLASGESTEVTDSVAVAWEWSPDSSRLAWLEADSSGLAKWQFWSTDPNVAGDLPGNLRAPSLRLSRKYLSSYLPFFAQYTHSVTGWSPDSTAFATAGSAEGVGGIWIHLVDFDAPVLPVAEGDFVTWGGGPTPPASGAAIT